MDVKINKEIRTYRENLFFGLTLRQCICSIFAIVIAAGLYALLHDKLDKETMSWVCIIGAAPVAAAGFFRYNGLTLGKFLWAFVKSELLLAAPRVWRSENYWLEAIQQEQKETQHEVKE